MEEEFGKARDKVRAALAKVYDRNNKSMQELYGGSKDEAGDSDDEGLLDPFGNPEKREVLPYIPPIEPTEDGYPGLMPPVG